ncbi:helix-turn-helix transcriptional regulator [Streptomyces phaeochromogenes]|uniref:Helix-turn-helix domain-containing protein n=1 Tax=Streptomyces phaeochromogenes TaxID=1923 RepID=A0ABZ1H968_STRPH|nr:helix-turn-helix transcriptional regulator [Streptomyces phaeochromogenes]MCX5600794.1 helix-turn-helix domain-containing protein [Streptomyces phaeochromogenes]WRZ28517.1 helix-turn-helix domain-containing protein [Streptomyces phaeochromogenes]WSD14096.1 helix-turn-helix domain-containing protein [Streptomyces phaeochromogenes]WSJ08964.1 helix-turn-helix domain-containing protein [Streptomyces phaeochromogenes]WSS92997.1 helix-turn-helix domain-containing protein [Streptomyces phaeochromo
MTAETDWGGAPSVLRMILGRQLEELRNRAGLTFEQAGAAIGVSHSTIRRMEAAKVARLRLPDAEKLLQVYGVTDQQEIDTFLKSVREANKRGWWHTYRDVLPDWFAAYLSLEQAALQIRAYEAQFVHGLLQTEEYARALLGAGNPHAATEATERRVALRMRRQELLSRPSPPRVWIVMDETVLRWPVGGAEVMRAQIDHLIAVNSLPQVTLQIMPFKNGPHPAMRAGAFHLFRFRARELPDIVYLNGLVGAVYLDKDDDVLVYREALDRLGAQATPARKTEALLGAIRKEL